MLYTSALRRLSGVTQVVASTEGSVFHNRLTHTLECAQIARRLAEYLRRQQPDYADELDPEVCEAAALAHDLGHPPYGHVAEEELHDHITNALHEPDGFNGNAQSFRIVTKVSRRHENFPGLNLTRASLRGVLKYPWLRLAGDRDRDRRWGAFRTEEEDFAWARELRRRQVGVQGAATLEAQVMDWADDVAYAVHDVYDFYKAGVVPLDRLLRQDGTELTNFFDRAFERWESKKLHESWNKEELRGWLMKLLDWMAQDSIIRPWDGSQEQRAVLRSVTAKLIRRYFLSPYDEESGPELGPTIIEGEDGNPILQRDNRAKREVALLKEVIWVYVILNPRLASQQAGHRAIIRFLFERYYEAAREGGPLLSWDTRDEIKRMKERRLSEEDLRREHVRIATDALCAMTDDQAFRLFQRLKGQSMSSILDAMP